MWISGRGRGKAGSDVDEAEAEGRGAAGWSGGGGRAGGGGSGSRGGEDAGSGVATVGVTAVTVWTGGVVSGAGPLLVGSSGDGVGCLSVYVAVWKKPKYSRACPALASLSLQDDMR